MSPLSLRTSLIVTASLVGIGFGSGGCNMHRVDDSGPTACAADAFESNDTQQTAHELGRLQDDPDSGRGLTATVHRGDDVDWYRVHVSDTGLGGDPNIAVTVPQGYAVTTWFVCDHGRLLDKTCLQGSSEYMTVEGIEGCRGSAREPSTDQNGATTYPSEVVAASTSDCSGTSNDDGTLYIRVERTSSYSAACTYELSIAVD